MNKGVSLTLTNHSSLHPCSCYLCFGLLPGPHPSSFSPTTTRPHPFPCHLRAPTCMQHPPAHRPPPPAVQVPAALPCQVLDSLLIALRVGLQRQLLDEPLGVGMWGQGLGEGEGAGVHMRVGVHVRVGGACEGGGSWGCRQGRTHTQPSWRRSCAALRRFGPTLAGQQQHVPARRKNGRAAAAAALSKEPLRKSASSWPLQLLQQLVQLQRAPLQRSHPPLRPTQCRGPGPPPCPGPVRGCASQNWRGATTLRGPPGRSAPLRRRGQGRGRAAWRAAGGGPLHRMGLGVRGE